MISVEENLNKQFKNIEIKQVIFKIHEFIIRLNSNLSSFIDKFKKCIVNIFKFYRKHQFKIYRKSKYIKRVRNRNKLYEKRFKAGIIRRK